MFYVCFFSGKSVYKYISLNLFHLLYSDCGTFIKFHHPTTMLVASLIHILPQMEMILVYTLFICTHASTDKAADCLRSSFYLQLVSFKSSTTHPKFSPFPGLISFTTFSRFNHQLPLCPPNSISHPWPWVNPGSIPPTLLLLHLCDNTKTCVVLRGLSAGTGNPRRSQLALEHHRQFVHHTSFHLAPFPTQFWIKYKKMFHWQDK